MAVTETHREAVTWRVHPARERVGAACFALAIVGATMWAVAELMESLWWAALPFVFFLITLQRFFLPSAFRIDDDGISAGTLLSTNRIRWPDVRRFQHDTHGGFLSDRKRPSFRDAFHGVHLVFHKNGEEVVQVIEERMASQREVAS